MKSDKEKADEILKARDKARKEFAETNDEGRDPIEEDLKREQEIGNAGLAVGIGLKRSG
jgi:hypothetical protein